MTFRQAAVLALVGWYLMMPSPLRAAGNPIPVPGTTDMEGYVNPHPFATPPLERQVLDVEMAKIFPHMRELTELQSIIPPNTLYHSPHESPPMAQPCGTWAP